METIIAVILGWLFGILGQRPIIYIQNSFKKPSLKRSILAELKGVKFTFATASAILYSRVGKLDKKFLTWYQSIMKTYDGFYSDLNLPESINSLLQAEDKDLATALESMKVSKDLKGRKLSLKKYNIPFIDSNYSELHLFNVEFQKSVLEIREQVKHFNEDVDIARFYFEKTFDSGLSVENYKRLQGNLDSAYLHMGDMAVDIAKNISAFIDRST